MVFSFWSAVKSIPFVRETIDAIAVKSDTITNSGSPLQAAFDTVLGSSLSNQVFYILMWGLVGILVYFAVIIISQGNQQIFEALSPKGNKGRANGALWHELISRLVFRAFILVIWTMFFFISVGFLVPVSVSSVQAASDFNSLEDVQFMLYAFTILFATFHLHVIFLRLFVIRVRVFGQADEAILYE